MRPNGLRLSGERLRVRCSRGLGDNHILALNEAAGVLTRLDMFEFDVVRQLSKQRDAFAYQHRYARDGYALYEPRSKKTLDCNPAVHVDMPDAASGKL